MTVTTHAAHIGYAARHKSDQLARQARIEGLVRGPAHMAAGNRHCTGVLTQISAITWAPHEVALTVAAAHTKEVPDGYQDSRSRRS